MRSYQEMVVIPMKQMSEDNQQLTYLKNKVVKEQEKSKTLKDTVILMSDKLRQTSEDNRIVRLRTKMQHEESKEMMDYQEQFFKDQIDKIHKHTEEKEKEYEKLLQVERFKATKDSSLRNKIEKFIESQNKGVEEFLAKREELMQAHDEKMNKMKQKHWAEEVELEKEFDAVLTKLIGEYAPSSLPSSPK